ncbi:hypothetical protein [Sphingobium nicotianae]|uniref:Transmembrane protein n=1 Tax=Sphingobium nicotianae TaxID=2782607 RepID=A0A9X1DB70_9SPHN|nr:hypothetical protein [Sphingobium nicotianae]MBT2186835.1 hypothetical protein [Sphingobium nicotianae]
MMAANDKEDVMEVRTSRGMSTVEIFPFLLIPVLIYNLLALFSAPPLAGATEPTLFATLRGEAFSLQMLSGSSLSLSWGDMLLLLAIVFLLVEIVKAPRTASPSIINHMLSMGVFIFCLVEFLMLRSFASATFFLMTMMVLLDAMAGMAVTIISARRDFDVSGGSSS